MPDMSIDKRSTRHAAMAMDELVPKEVRDVPGVVTELDNLNQIVGVLQENVERLEHRLQPVILEVPLPSDPGMAEDVPQRSTVAMNIGDSVSRIRYLNDRINAMLYRLDI